MKELEIGDIISIREWSGDIIEMKVQKLDVSKVHGPAVHGVQIGESRHVALPQSHIIETARIDNIGWGKWDLIHPDGTTERLRSKKAALDRAEEIGYIVTEV